MKYFTNCTTLEDLKKEFRRLCMIHHPDRGGDTATMAAINAEYEAVFPLLKIAYNRTAETPTTETAASTRSEFYTQNGWAGSRYESGRSLKEIAQLVRQFIKDQFPNYKFSVRTHYASMCQELHVEMKEAPCKIYKDFEELTLEDKSLLIRRMRSNRLIELDSWSQAELKTEFERVWSTYSGSFWRCHSDQIAAAIEAVDGYVNSFRYSDCDGMQDYFDVNFWYFGCKSDYVQYVPKTARITATKAKKEEPAKESAVSLRVEFNEEFSGIEVYFPAKPDEATRNALKAAGFRWHHKKGCWYTKNTEEQLQALRLIAEKTA